MGKSPVNISRACWVGRGENEPVRVRFTCSRVYGSGRVHWLSKKRCERQVMGNRPLTKVDMVGVLRIGGGMGVEE